MLHIILFLLKILGCILLAILGLILILLLIVLFVPIRYDVFGSLYGNPEASAKVSWLFGIVKATAEFKDKRLRFQVKLFIKTLIDSEKKNESEPVSKVESKDVTLNENIIINEDSSPRLSAEQSGGNEERIKNDSNPNFVNKSKSDHSKSKTKKEKRKKEKRIKEKKHKNKEKNSLLEKLGLIIDSFIDRIESFADNTEEKFDHISCKLNKIERFINAECTQKSIVFIKRMLFSILKHIAPNNVSGNIHFGMDKPSTTGKILGYASAFYPLYSDSINLMPDFEHKIIEGDLKINGGIQLYIFVLWALKALLCKDIRKLIKYMKHLKK